MRLVLSLLAVSLIPPAATASAQPSPVPPLARSGAAAGRGCATFPATKLRVRLSVIESRIGDPKPVIRDVVSDTWSRQGLSIEWVSNPPDSPPSWEGVDAWVTVRHAPAGERRLDPLGGAMFAGDAPNGLVFVSIDATIRWLHAAQARRLGLKPADYAALSLKHVLPALHAMLGHVVAHEIGHVALGSRDHGKHGLMKPVYDDLVALSRPAPLPLDGRNRARLAARLKASAACQALQARFAGAPR